MFNSDFPLPPAMKLSFGDDFNGSSIDQTKWDILHEPRRSHWWNRDAAYISNGLLVLRTQRGGDGKYNSGAIRSKLKFGPGYYEARIYCGKHGGHWPAFWLWCPAVLQVGNEGVDGTEIDIFEAPYRRTVNLGLHWDGYEANHKSVSHTVDVAGLRDSWHKFGLWWTPIQYIFYVDGVEVWRTSAGGVSKVPANILLTDEVDNWGGTIDCTVDYCYVDYVRYYAETT